MQPKHFLLISFIIGLISFNARAFVAEAPLSENQKLVLFWPDAQIKILPGSAKNFRLKIDGVSDSQVQMSAEPGRVIVKPKNLDTKDLSKGAYPKITVEITSAPQAIEIHCLEGQVTITQWTREVSIQMQKGRVLSKDGKSSIAVHSQKGDIQILDHQGKVEVDSYAAAVTLKNITGDVEVENFSGETHLEKIKGAVTLRQNQGNAKVLASEGSLQFETNKANLSTGAFNGRIEGQSQEGNINLTLAPNPDVHLKSQAGRVTLQAPAGVIPYLNLSSVEGEIYLPTYLKVSREVGGRFFRGHLRGDKPLGRVLVQSQESAIFVK